MKINKQEKAQKQEQKTQTQDHRTVQDLCNTANSMVDNLIIKLDLEKNNSFQILRIKQITPAKVGIGAVIYTNDGKYMASDDDIKFLITTKEFTVSKQFKL